MIGKGLGLEPAVSKGPDVTLRSVQLAATLLATAGGAIAEGDLDDYRREQRPATDHVLFAQQAPATTTIYKAPDDASQRNSAVAPPSQLTERTLQSIENAKGEGNLALAFSLFCFNAHLFGPEHAELKQSLAQGLREQLHTAESEMLKNWRDPSAAVQISDQLFERLIVANDPAPGYMRAILEEYVGAAPERLALLEKLASRGLKITSMPPENALNLIHTPSLCGWQTVLENGQFRNVTNPFIYLNPAASGAIPSIQFGGAVFGHELNHAFSNLAALTRHQLELPLRHDLIPEDRGFLEEELASHLLQASRFTQARGIAAPSDAQLLHTFGTYARERVQALVPASQLDPAISDRQAIVLYLGRLYEDSPAAPKKADIRQIFRTLEEQCSPGELAQIRRNFTSLLPEIHSTQQERALPVQLQRISEEAAQLQKDLARQIKEIKGTPYGTLNLQTRLDSLARRLFRLEAEAAAEMPGAAAAVDPERATKKLSDYSSRRESSPQSSEMALKELEKAVGIFAGKAKQAESIVSPSSPERVIWVTAGNLLDELGSVQRLLNATQKNPAN